MFGRRRTDQSDGRRGSARSGQSGRMTTTTGGVMHRGWTAGTDVGHRLAIVGTLIGLALAGTLGGASVAQAKDGTATYLDAAWVHFQDYGDHLTVCDTKPDGHSAVGIINGVQIWASGGAGTCEHRNYNFPEGTFIIIQACVGESASRTLLACGTPVDARA
jgi:hypothetical protein